MTRSTLLRVTFCSCLKVNKTLSLVLNEIYKWKEKRAMCGKWIIGSTVLAHFFSFLFFFAKYSVLPALDKRLFSVLSDWHRSRIFLTGVTLHPQDEALHVIVAFTLMVLCAGCSCTTAPGTSMEAAEATLQPANPAKRIHPLDLLKRIHKIHKRGINCPDGMSSCPSGDTCCVMSSNGYGCCPLTNAVCCNDGVHCCPEDYSCGSGGDFYK